MSKRNLRKLFGEGWNKLFGKEEDKSKLRTQSLYRAQKFSATDMIGTPHILVLQFWLIYFYKR